MFNEELGSLLGDIFGEDIKPTEMSSELNGKVIGIYGSNGSGKTKVVSRLVDNVVFLSCENGLSGTTGCMQIKIKSWSGFISAVKKLENKKLVAQLEEGKQIAVAIDGYENLAKYCEDYICSQEGVDAIGDGNGGYGLWKEYLNELNKQLTKLFNIGYCVVIITHPKEVKNKKGEVVRIDLNLDSRAKKVLCDNADIVAYIENNGVDENGKLIKSSAYFVESEDFFARCRYDHMQPMLKEFTAENFRKAIDEAIKTQINDEGAEDHTALEIKEMFEEKELTHAELVEEIKNIFVNNIADNEGLEEKYAEIIETHLGDILVSETNHKHDEALKCILNDLRELVC